MYQKVCLCCSCLSPIKYCSSVHGHVHMAVYTACTRTSTPAHTPPYSPCTGRAHLYTVRVHTVAGRAHMYTTVYTACTRPCTVLFTCSPVHGPCTQLCTLTARTWPCARAGRVLIHASTRFTAKESTSSYELNQI